MPIQTPDFWYKPFPTLTARLLAPIGRAYAALGKLRRHMMPAVPVTVPLVVVGNVLAGGSGKTPLTIDLAERLTARGARVHLIAKGYGGKLTGPLQVNPQDHMAEDVGDEALLLARVAPTWIGQDRGKTYQAAAAAGADLVISDDGLQNPGLANATLRLLVSSGQRGLGNGLLIPAGPLREPLADAEARCHALIDIGGPQGQNASPLPTLNADFVQERPDWLKGARVVAFCGLGNPERFFFSLKDAGAELQAALAFPDHHPYSGADLAQLERTAREKNAKLVTTTKDAVKLPPAWRDKVAILDGRLIWRDPAALEALLDRLYPTPAPRS